MASRAHYQGEGKIIDAGVFLGASTRLFAHGIRANAKADAILTAHPKPISTFEQGLLGPGMPAFFERHNIDTAGLLEGKSFAPLFRKMIEDVAPMIDLNFGDILTQSWGDEPIEICFLDVVKSYGINRFTIENFISRLIPGKSILIQQDYFIDRLPFLKVSQELLAPYFEYLGNAQSSAYFRLTKPIPPEALTEAADPHALPVNRQMQLIDQCAERVSFDRERQLLTLFSKVIVAVAHDGAEAGHAIEAELSAVFPDEYNEKSPARNRIAMAKKQLLRFDYKVPVPTAE